METKTAITITEDQFHDVQIQLADLTKRAAKLGVQAPSVEVLDTFEKSVVLNEAFGITRNERFYNVVLHDPVVMYDGWSFVACVDHTTGVVHTAGNAPEGTVREYQNIDPLCEHCGRKMARNKTVIVRHEDGTVKQVGSSCMKAFITGFPSLSSALFRFLDDARWDDDGDMFGGLGLPTVESTDPLSFIAVANAVVRSLGWSPASFEHNATKAIVIDLMFGKPDKEQRERYRNVQVGLDDYASAEKMIAWLRERDAVSDFDLNLLAACTAPRVGKNAGIVAFLPEAWNRHLQGQREKQDRESGEQSDCPTGRTLVVGEVIGIKEVDSYYTYSGIARKMTVRDDSGFRVYGNVPNAFDSDRTFGVGSRVQFSANLTRSDGSSDFGFFSRPTKLVLVGSEPAVYKLPKTESRDHDEDDI